MAKRPARDLTVGALFALALIIVALAIMALGGESGVWFERVEYVAVFPDATGLLGGAPVRMNGVQVGTVTDIRLPTDPQSPGIEVRLGIDPHYAERVRTDSRAALRILQFLTNEKYIEIVPGSPEQPALEPGATIQRLVEVGVVEQGEVIADNLAEITVALKRILEPLERGQGLIGQMLVDPNFGTKGLESLGKTLENMNALTDDLAAGRGTLGRLLQDEALAKRLDKMASAFEDLASVAQAVARREGVIGDLLEEGGSAEQALADLRDAAASFKRLAAQFENGEGLLARLLTDQNYAEGLRADLERTLHNAAEITRKIEEGEGTLGALVNDRVLYDSAEEIVAGVDDSKFARWLMRHYQKKGIKAEKEEPKAPAGGP